MNSKMLQRTSIVLKGEGYASVNILYFVSWPVTPNHNQIYHSTVKQHAQSKPEH